MGVVEGEGGTLAHTGGVSLNHFLSLTLLSSVRDIGWQAWL